MYWADSTTICLCIQSFSAWWQTTNQPGDPSASLLLTSVRRQSFAIILRIAVVINIVIRIIVVTRQISRWIMVLVQVVAHYDKPHNHHICHCVYINIIIFFIITIIKSSLSSTFDKNQYHYHHQSQFNAASPHCTLFNSTSLCSVLLLSILCFVQHILLFFFSTFVSSLFCATSPK